MPVHHTYRDGVLALVVDGDYTAEGLRLAGTRALADTSVRLPTPLLLDLSGAAGLSRTAVQALQTAAEFFGDREADVTRVAILAPGRTARSVLKMASRKVSSAMQVETFGRPDEARAWLAQR